MVRQRQVLSQRAYGADIFRPVLPSLRVPTDARAEPIKHICYTSVGMVLNAHERLARGQFRLDDLLADRPDAIHCRPYVGSEDLRIPNSLAGDCLFAAARIHYLEYGTARVPSLIRRPTFPELYDREKVMAGEFGGALHDDGTLDPLGFLACNHSIFLFVPWHLLDGIRNRALLDRERELGRMRSALADVSQLYPLPFLAGLFNSTPWQRLMEGRASSSVHGRSQPINYADQCVPVPGASMAAAVGEAANAASREGRALGHLLAAGWERRVGGWCAPPLLPPATQTVPLAIARTRWGITIERPTARCGSLRSEGLALLTGQRVAARFTEGTPVEAMDYLLRILTPQGDATLQAAETSGLPVPLRPDDAAALERAQLAAEGEAMRREETILRLRREIDEWIGPLFEALPHPPIEVFDPIAR